MPITYDETNDIWELTNPTEQEKESLTALAIQDIVDFFGNEVGHRIVSAAKRVEAQAAQENGNKDAAQAGAGSFSTGDVGNA